MYNNKTIICLPQQDNYLSAGSETVFYPENRGSIEMMFLDFTVTPDVDSDTATPLASPYLIENVFLESNGNIVSRLTTTYLVGRIEELSKSDVARIEESCKLPNTILAGITYKCSLPLFFYAIDGQSIDLNLYKNIAIRCTLKSNYEKMGFTANTVVIKTKLTVHYEGHKNERLKNSYNIIQYPQVSLPNASVEHNLQVKIASKISNVYLMIREESITFNKCIINSVTATYANGMTQEFNNSSNYKLGNFGSVNTGSVFKLSFCSRYEGNGYLKTNLENRPVYLLIKYVATDSADYKLFSSYEYQSDIIEDKGRLLETIKEGL